MTDFIFKIDFENSFHKMYIGKLIKANQYYENDIKMQYLDDYDIDDFMGYPINIRNTMVDECKAHIKKSYNDSSINGYFIATKKKNNKVGVCGFVLYNIEGNKHYHLTFILIDKKYRNKGYGSMLLKELQNEFDKDSESNINLLFMYVKVELYNQKNKKWYLKNEFITEDDFSSKLNIFHSAGAKNKYDKFYYFKRDNIKNIIALSLKINLGKIII